MKLSELFSAYPYRALCGAENVTIASLCENASEVEAKSAFILVKRDDPSYRENIFAAEQKGAVVIVAQEGEEDLETALPCLYVKNVRQARSVLWCRFYGEPQKELSLTAVTGTNGKTTVACMLSHILNCAGLRTGYIGTLGVFDGKEALEEYRESTMTTPSPKFLFQALAAFAKRGIKHAVLEVSSHALCQERTYPIFFDTAIFTNLSEDHLDYHQTLEKYFEAKRKLFSSCRRALINVDDAYGEKLYSLLSCEKYSFGILQDAFFRVTDLHEKEEGRTQYTCLFPHGKISADYPLFGAFNIYNSLASLACAHLIGVSDPKIEVAMKTLPAAKGRLEAIVRESGTIPFSVIIDYAHTPDAMEQTIKIVKKRTRGKLFVLFGAGGEREHEKRAVMGKIAEKEADSVFLTADNSRSEHTRDIISDILSGMEKKERICVIEDRKEAILTALSKLKNGDVLLLLGKGHEEYILDRNGKRPFSETEIVKEWVGKHYGF